MFLNRRTTFAIVSRNLVPSARDWVAEAAIAAMILCAAAPSAHADGDEAKTVMVSTRGVDLVSSQGKAELNRRIELAVRRVCDGGDVGSLAARNFYDACHEGAMKGVTPQIQVLIARARGPGASGEIKVADGRP